MSAIINDVVLSGSDATSQNGIQLDTNQCFNVSFHCVLSDSTGAGTLAIQASNDVCPTGQTSQTFVVTNWVQIPGATAAIAAGAKQAIIPISNAAYRWMRAVYTATTPGTGTVTVSRFEQSF